MGTGYDGFFIRRMRHKDELIQFFVKKTYYVRVIRNGLKDSTVVRLNFLSSRASRMTGGEAHRRKAHRILHALSMIKIGSTLCEYKQF